MQIKSCLKTQGLLNVIHYTVYLFISNIGTGSPGGRQRQAERPKSRRVNYQQNELFHPQPPPAPSCVLGAPAPPARPQCPLALLAVPFSLWVFKSHFSLSFSICPLTRVSASLCVLISSLPFCLCFRLSLLFSLSLAVSFSTPGLFCRSLWPFSVSLIASCNRDRDLE